MSWNYRLIHHDKTAPEDWYAIHEVYYDDRSETVQFWSTEPIAVECRTKKEVIKELKRMMKDIKKYPILKLSELEKSILFEGKSIE